MKSFQMIEIFSPLFLIIIWFQIHFILASPPLDQTIEQNYNTIVQNQNPEIFIHTINDQFNLISKARQQFLSSIQENMEQLLSLYHQEKNSVQRIEITQNCLTYLTHLIPLEKVFEQPTPDKVKKIWSMEKKYNESMEIFFNYYDEFRHKYLIIAYFILEYNNNNNPGNNITFQWMTKHVIGLAIDLYASFEEKWKEYQLDQPTHQKSLTNQTKNLIAYLSFSRHAINRFLSTYKKNNEIDVSKYIIKFNEILSKIETIEIRLFFSIMWFPWDNSLASKTSFYYLGQLSMERLRQLNNKISYYAHQVNPHIYRNELNSLSIKDIEASEPVVRFGYYMKSFAEKIRKIQNIFDHFFEQNLSIIKEIKFVQLLEQFDSLRSKYHHYACVEDSLHHYILKRNTKTNLLSFDKKFEASNELLMDEKKNTLKEVTEEEKNSLMNHHSKGIDYKINSTNIPRNSKIPLRNPSTKGVLHHIRRFSEGDKKRNSNLKKTKLTTDAEIEGLSYHLNPNSSFCQLPSSSDNNLIKKFPSISHLLSKIRRRSSIDESLNENVVDDISIINFFNLFSGLRSHLSFNMKQTKNKMDE